jgi:hypothetical protein
MAGTMLFGNNNCYTSAWISGQTIGNYWLYYPMRNGYSGYSYRNYPAEQSEGFSLSYDTDTGLITISVPDGYGTDATGTWSLSYVFGPPDSAGNLRQRQCGVSNPRIYSCTREAVVSCAAIDRNTTPGQYKLVVSLALGDSEGPLTGIEWSPAPTSGQGTMAATYEGRIYNTIYSGYVKATDADGCLVLVNFSFTQKLGGYPPSCG